MIGQAIGKPGIDSPLCATGAADHPFRYSITASNMRAADTAVLALVITAGVDVTNQRFDAPHHLSCRGVRWRPHRVADWRRANDRSEGRT